jgi:two-component system NtrC family response regulator
MAAVNSRTQIPEAGALGAGSVTAEDLLRAQAVLVVDDEPGMRYFLHRALHRACAAVEVADSVEVADKLRRRHHFDLMIVDIRLHNASGVAWLQSLRDQGDQTAVIFITAFADLDMAIQALRAGAADFILKPFRLEQMMSAVKRCAERRHMLRENILLKRQMATLRPPRGIVGESDSIRQTMEMVERVAPSGTTILVEGETGTGKELIARAIHDASDRKGAFVALNCGSIPPELIESELFGHVKGAFTGAAQEREGLFQFASEGTLFLDEISEMSLNMQAKLLRVLEERRMRPVGAEREIPVSARMIAATNRTLSEEVRVGRFRQDLFYRLEVVTLTVPPLRERLEDLPVLIDYFVDTLATELRVEPITLSYTEIDRLRDYRWPGNVRELRNTVERFLLLGQLPRDAGGIPADESPETAEQRASGFPTDWPLEKVEEAHIRSVLAETGGNKAAAARRLGTSRKTLERKLKKWQGMEAALES